MRLSDGTGSQDNSSRQRTHNQLRLLQKERWFLVHTLPHGERKAQRHLQAQGFRVFLPEMTKTTRHARQLRTVRAPFFPRYLFVILDLNRDRWLSVRSTFGVSYLISCDNQPTPVPQGVVENLIVRSTDMGSATGEGLKMGQKISVTSGPFVGLLGTLDRLDERGRVRVLLELMNTVVPVEIERVRLLGVS
jgi:transcription elongation factor/antiterminator RfaH